MDQQQIREKKLEALQKICIFLEENADIYQLQEAYKMVEKIIINIANNPMEYKYRTIKLSNPKLKQVVFCIDKIEQLFMQFGFSLIESEQKLVLEDNFIGEIYLQLNNFKGWAKLQQIKCQNQIQEYQLLKESLLNNQYIDQSTLTKSCGFCRQNRVLLFKCSCSKIQYCSFKCKQDHKPTHIQQCSQYLREEIEGILQPQIDQNQPKIISGLKNIGNTCYMNAGIQVLNNSQYLFEVLFKGEIRRQIELQLQEIQKQNYKNEEISLLAGFYIMLSNLKNNNLPVYNPRIFKQILGRYFPMFNGYNQQDSSEFLILTLNQLRNEIEGLVKDQNTIQILNNVFQGNLTSQIQCLQCNLISKKQEEFSILTLQLENFQEKEVFTLQNLLQNFQQQEILEGENQVFCENCQVKQNHSKQIVIDRFPQMLLIQLKRFDKSLVEKSLNSLQKKALEKQVEEKADLTESEKEQIQNQLKQFTQLEMQITKNNQKVEVPLQFESNSVLQKKNQQNSLFELKGTINHFGQYNGGHYTAFSKDIQNNQWYEYDDQEVRQVQNINQTIKNNSSNVYVAVYEGIQVQYF